ncbi:flagellar basal-body MS-ring/collar protein FliF [Thiomicrorhabdus sp. zzn3]|uniref:flagellar basal-body MS-ring/collar protein FliF n=1 Tax=Thiomicrorhabdus sp. zzn3 TaxID=3039775 RepID=UPI0024374025|nr:flagellar basal-body MS-ring/collar protein FliF [Thiomicrorhabdus sp. zzn3]MDG6777632.1 flagellar basal-body MS-ring/collar protein FliF [Thiomicrorhabdus sp. zzn3]
MADQQASMDPTLTPQQPTGFGSTLLNNLMALSVAKQVSLVIALAAAVALVVGILLWSQDKPYTLLFGSLDAKDVNEVVQTLEQEQVDYRIDQTSGGILVPSDQVYSLRLKLAAAGYPKQAATGYQLLDVEQGFGISQFKETTQYHRALEGELAKSVASINAVKSARVMLGMPKRSVFVRKQQKPSASVVVKLYPGRSLNDEQVSSIVYLVSSSIPNMDVKDVTVVDQNGNLLTGDAHASGTLNMSIKQLDYTRMVEETLSNRIIKLLAPIVGGENKVRAQVTAELDFTQQEQTRENYEPDPEAIRSEQKIKEINRNEGPTGIPGALTNQPPRAGIAPEEGYSGQNADPNLRNSSEKTTKNYELDRTVSHIKNSVGNIHRLSVAVVLDDKTSLDAEQNLVRTPLTEDELLRYRRLVSDTVGLDEARGDTLTVVNASFVVAPQEEEEPAPIWQQNWFWDLVKQLLAGLAVLIIIFGVIRPMLKELSKKEEVVTYLEEVPEEEEEIENVDEISKALEQMNEEVEQTAAEAEAESDEEHDMIEKVRTLVASDPKVAAHIIKQWMSGSK